MKNSLFKRVAAAAAAVPLALTQCLTFTSVAAGNDAVQLEGNTSTGFEIPKNVTIDSLLKIDAGETVSKWNEEVRTALDAKVGKTGEIKFEDYFPNYAEKIQKLIDEGYGPDDGYGATVAKLVEEYVAVNPVTYKIKNNKDVVLTIEVSPINWNESLAFTPQEALEKLADKHNLDALRHVDFSSVLAAGKIEITLGTSELLDGTTVPVSLVYKPADGGELNSVQFFEYCCKKLEGLRQCGLDAIEENYVGDLASRREKAKAKYNEKIDKIREKFDLAYSYANRALTTEKEGKYSSFSEAATAANEFLAKKELYQRKGHNKTIPTTVDEALARDKVKRALNKILTISDEKAEKRGSNIDITEEQIAQFVDSIGSRSLKEADGTIRATDFEIVVNKNTAEFVGAIDDAEAAEVKAYVEGNGYEYIGSYKKITSKVNFNGIDTLDIGDVDLKIERILVTNTTTTATEESTTTTDVTTTQGSETTSSTTATGTDVTTSSTTATGTDVTTSSTTATGTDVTTSTTATGTDVTTSATATGTDVTTSSTTGTGVTTSSTTATGTDVTTSSTTGTGVTTSSTTATGTDVTTSTTTEETTTTTTTTAPVVSSVVESVYVEIETTNGFYLNTEKSFDASQIKKATLHVIYGVGYMNGEKPVMSDEHPEETIDITDKVGFGEATPANTYKKVANKFDYNVQLTYEGDNITDKNGNKIINKGEFLKDKTGATASAVVYIGVKGDTNLDNMCDGRDATFTLTYYAKSSTAKNGETFQLSPSTLVDSVDSVYDDFAAFLSDVKWDKTENHSRFAKKNERLVDARDATSILTFYSIASTEQYKEIADSDPEQIWSQAAKNND